MVWGPQGKWPSLTVKAQSFMRWRFGGRKDPSSGLGSEGGPWRRAPGQAPQDGNRVLAGVPLTRPGAGAGASGRGLRPQMDLSPPAGLGLHLRPQLLPLCPGHVLHLAAAQGQQEGWECRDPGQAGLLQPLLCLCLTLHPRQPSLPLLAPGPHPSRTPGESPPVLPRPRGCGSQEVPDSGSIRLSASREPT